MLLEMDQTDIQKASAERSEDSRYCFTSNLNSLSLRFLGVEILSPQFGIPPKFFIFMTL